LENITTIIKGCIEQKHAYQKILYEQYYGFALKVVFRYIYRYEKAKDVVNDGFVKLFRNFEKFEPAADGDNEKMLMGWLKRILVNTAIDELRRGNMLPEIGGNSDDCWEIKDNSQDADQQLLYKDLIILVKELPPNYRVIFNLYVIDGYSHPEIADMLNMSVGSSRSGLSRARAILQNGIKKMEEGYLCRI
jgi:RNA polymerase sigma-70 factor (ECF subfamily)